MRDSFRQELSGNILPFWSRMVREDGSFPGRIDVYGRVDSAAPISAVMAFRMLWMFSSVSRHLEDERSGKMADRLYGYVARTFVDGVNGGVWWSVSADGQVLSDKKQSYAIGFAIYALSEYALLRGSAEAGRLAMQLFYCLEEKAWDSEDYGYVEALSADWSTLEDVRLSEKDMNAVFTMNTHLHILEPYTNLYLLTHDGRVADAVARLLDIFHSRIYCEESGHLGSFFSSDWKRLDSEISYGHDIEASWLICEAADAIGASERMYYDMADRLVVACEDGFREDGSLVYRCESGRWDEERHWWVQAEAVVGLMKMYRRTGDERWLGKCSKVWEYIRGNIIDSEGGEWFWSRLSDGSVNMDEDKAGFWKCPYHNGRMCVEMLKELV